MFAEFLYAFLQWKTLGFEGDETFHLWPFPQCTLQLTGKNVSIKTKTCRQS